MGDRALVRLLSAEEKTPSKESEGLFRVSFAERLKGFKELFKESCCPF